MNPTDLAQDARITAANLTAALMLDPGGRDTVRGDIDAWRSCMGEAAAVLDRVAIHLASSAGDRDDDDTFGPAVADKCREFFRALDMRETRRDGIRKRHEQAGASTRELSDMLLGKRGGV